MPPAKITAHELPLTKIVIVCIAFATVNVGVVNGPYLFFFMWTVASRQRYTESVINEKYKY